MNSKLTFIVLSVCLFGFAQAGLVQFKDCGSKKGVIESVDIEGCTKTPCTFIKGKSASMKLKFTSSVNTSKLTSKVNGIKFGVPLPFPLPETDSCKLGANCPVTKGDSNEITITLPILNEYPKISVDVRWQILDDNKNVVVCFRIPVKISA